MIPIIIMNHGLFGKELIATAEMVVGKLEEVQAVSLMPGMTLEDYLEHLYGGTPCNVAMMLRQRYELKVICGMNLPMLLELAGARESGEDVAQIAETIMNTAREGILEPAKEVEETEVDAWGGDE